MANVVHNLSTAGTSYPLGTIHYIEGTGTTAGTWLGTDNSITAYYDGLTIAYKINIAGASTTTLNINNLGAKTVRRNASNVTTQYPVNSVIHLTYTTISGTSYWQCADYDSNSDAKTTSENTSSKIFLVGATSQSTSGVTTYSHDTAYVGTDGCLYSNSTKVSVDGHTHSYAGSSSAGGAANSAVKATQDGSGNVITSTYATKTELNGKAASDHTHTTYASTVTTTGSGNAITSITQSGNTITATKGSTFLTAHPTISKSTDSTSTASPAHGGTFTVVDSVTRDGNGHVTKINTKTVTLPTDSNTDTKVAQTRSTTASYRPLLLHYTYAAAGSDPGSATNQVYYHEAISACPSTGAIRATRFIENGTSLASKYAPISHTHSDTDTKVTQAAGLSYASSGTSNTELPVLLGYQSGTTAVTNTVNKSQYIRYNHSQGHFILGEGTSSTNTKSAGYGRVNMYLQGSVYLTLTNDSYGIYPAADNWNYLGKSDRQWARLYVGTVYENGQTLSDKYATKSSLTWSSIS